MGAVPVSYTHLDVYKRQLEIMKNIIINGEEAEIEKPKIKTEFKPLFNEKQ